MNKERMEDAIKNDRMDDLKNASRALVCLALACSNNEIVIEVVCALLKISEVFPSVLLDPPTQMNQFVSRIELDTSRYCILPSTKNLLSSHFS